MTAGKLLIKLWGQPAILCGGCGRLVSREGQSGFVRCDRCKHEAKVRAGR